MYDFKIDGFQAKISTIDGVFYIVSNRGELSFLNQNKNTMENSKYDSENDSYTLPESYQNIQYTYGDVGHDNINGIKLWYVGANRVFIENNFEEGLFLVDDRFNRIEFVHAPRFGFEGKDLCI